MGLFSIVREETEKLNIIGAYARLSMVSERWHVKITSIHMPPVTVTYDWDMSQTNSSEYLDEQLKSQEDLADILEKHKSRVHDTIVEFEDKDRKNKKQRIGSLPKMISEFVMLPLLPFGFALAKYVARNYNLQEKSYNDIREIAHSAKDYFRRMIVPDELKEKADECAIAADRIATLSTELSNLTSHIPLRVMVAFRSNYSHFMKQIRYDG